MEVTEKDGKHELRLNQFELDGLHEEIASNFVYEEDSSGSQLYVILQTLDEVKKNGQTEIKITIEGL